MRSELSAPPIFVLYTEEERRNEPVTRSTLKISTITFIYDIDDFIYYVAFSIVRIVRIVGLNDPLKCSNIKNMFESNTFYFRGH
tara:strand:+ start:357 stop:608 length:252 start_codon:yes stop_codon:yes gene_type:complete